MALVSWLAGWLVGWVVEGVGWLVGWLSLVEGLVGWFRLAGRMFKFD